MISQELIETEFQAAIQSCNEVISLERWRAKPTFITTYSHLSKYGEVYASDYGIRITEAFLGTDFVEALRETIRHELAHLCVNINRKKRSPSHGRDWTYVFERFTHDIDSELAEQQKVILAQETIKYKWSLYANTKSGERIFIGPFHKRSAKYTKYPRESGESHSVDGKTILSYEFEENFKSE
ncbi:SprT-like domain-containing protein [Vibrio owensii]|uniref:SprT-like domain-containing protein n=1 Tax=Vibrio harveyi group TaxID=717610 RepID=UPI003CC6D081